MKGGRRARTGATDGLPEAGRIGVTPHRLSGAQVVAGDELLLAELLLRVEAIAVDRERRPARSDRPAPELDRRRLRPVRFDSRAVHDAVAVRAAEAGPRSLVRCGDRRVEWRGRGGVAARRGCRVSGGGRQQPVLDRRRPSAREVEPLGPRRAIDAERGDEQAGERDDRGQPRPPAAGPESPGRYRPDHETKAQHRYADHVEQRSLPGTRHGVVEEGPGRGRPDRDDHERADPLGPGRAAREQPPHHDQCRAASDAEDRHRAAARRHDRPEEHHGQPEKSGGDAWPDP
jgi:hypothetical protein